MTPTHCLHRNSEKPFLWDDIFKDAFFPEDPWDRVSRTHPSRDAMLFWPKNVKSCCKHDGLEPSKQALLASRDVTISGQIIGSKWQRVFTLDDGCRHLGSSTRLVPVATSPENPSSMFS